MAEAGFPTLRGGNDIVDLVFSLQLLCQPQTRRFGCGVLNPPFYLDLEEGAGERGKQCLVSAEIPRLLCLLGCVLASQAHRECSRFIAFRGYMEAEEFQAPVVSLLYFTNITVTVHITELADVKVSNSVFSKCVLYQSAAEAGTTAWL